MVNYKHLYYFWAVAREGGIARASKRLNLTPQTISGQITVLEESMGVQLFNRVGRNLEITDTGRLILSYANEIFSLGNELEDVIHHLPEDRPQVFKVGVVDVLPKSIAHRILAPALKMSEPVRMICKEACLDTLLADLSIHHLDLVLADRPIPHTISTKGYSHKLGESSVSFFATKTLNKNLQVSFPECLNTARLLLPGSGSQLRSAIDHWLDKKRIYPKVVAEFDDSALMKAFGQEDAGIFIAPSVIRSEVEQQHNVMEIGQTTEVKEQFYAISVERKITHPVISQLMDAARERLFVEE